MKGPPKFKRATWTMLACALMSIVFNGVTLAQQDFTDARMEILWRRLYDASDHPLWSALERKNLNSLEVLPVDGELIWFNPRVGIPELGIAPGTPLTPSQKEVIARLFAVRIAPAGEGEAAAAWITHEGRAIHPNPGVLTLIADEGEIGADLVAKGVGETPAGRGRGGLLSTTDALLEAEVTLNLGEMGVRVFTPVAVIARKDAPGRAILVRGATSTLRYEDVDRFSATELRAVLDMVVRQRSDGTGKDIADTREWLEDFLPRAVGGNAGALQRIGILQPTIDRRDNHGIAGETVDWETTRLGEPSDSPRFKVQKERYWRETAKTIKRIAELLEEYASVSLSKAKEAFEGAFGDALRWGPSAEFKFDSALVRMLDVNQLRHLLGDADMGLNWPDDYREKSNIVSAMSMNGMVTDTQERLLSSGPGRIPAFSGVDLLRDVSRTERVEYSQQVLPGLSELGARYGLSDKGLSKGGEESVPRGAGDTGEGALEGFLDRLNDMKAKVTGKVGRRTVRK